MDLKSSRPEKSSSETRNLHNVTKKFCLHCKTDIYDIFVLIRIYK